MQGVPFDVAKGLLPNQDGWITDLNGMQVTGLYATGWIKRGPTGIIGTNRATVWQPFKRCCLTWMSVCSRPNRLSGPAAASCASWHSLYFTVRLASN